MQDLEVEIRLYNNQIKERRTELGISQKKLGLSCGTSGITVGRLECMKLSPKCQDGSWRKAALAVSRFFGIEPEEMFPPFTEIADAFKPPKMKVSSEELGRRFAMLEVPLLEAPVLPDDQVAEQFNNKALKQSITDAIETLTPREELVLRHRFGIGQKDGKTLQDVGKVFGVQRERIRQIEAKALRKLRHPSRAKNLRPYHDEDSDTAHQDVTLSRYIIIDRRTRVVGGVMKTTPLYYLVKENIYRDVTWQIHHNTGPERYGTCQIDKYLPDDPGEPSPVEIFHTEWGIKNEIRLHGYNLVDTFDIRPFLPNPAGAGDTSQVSTKQPDDSLTPDSGEPQHIKLVPFMESEFYTGNK